MPVPGLAREKLGFLTIGLFDGENPGPGHEVTPATIELGERLGFDSAWLGTSREIAAALYAHAAFREVTEVTFALPFTFGHEDYTQILTDTAARPGPARHWAGRPGPDAETADRPHGETGR